MQKIPSILLLIFVSLPGFAQQISTRDSLLKVITKAKDDTAKVQLLISAGQRFEGDSPELAKALYRQANVISKQINYTLGQIQFITNYTYLLNMQGSMDSSILLNKQSVVLARRINHKRYIAKTLFNTATAYQYADQMDSAVKYYEEGKTALRILNDVGMEAHANDLLQILYNALGDHDRAVKLGEMALAYYRKAGDPSRLAEVLINLGLGYGYKGAYEKALALDREALAISRTLDNDNLRSAVLLNIADYYVQKKAYSKTEPYFREALQVARRSKVRESEAIALRGLGLYYMAQKKYLKGKEYVSESMAITKADHLWAEHRKNLETMSSIMFALHDMPAAETFLQESVTIGDSLHGENIRKTTQELEQRYEAARKQERIAELENEKKIQELSLQQKSLMNLILIGGSCTLALILFLVYRTYRQRQKIQLQRMQELETQNHLAATEAVLKGEEQERSRLAKDLHDGLGGMLSGVRFSLNGVKSNAVMTPENQLAFERSLDMLDNSIREMRRVAHNMMPEALVKFGLDTALRDFCAEIENTGAIKIRYQSYGVDHVVIDQMVAITIYRVVQELTGNILKHASAKEALVQLSVTDGRISLTVEDDGRGFNPEHPGDHKGIGLTSIRKRIALMKGDVHIQSHPGEGTSVLIELNHVVA